MRYRVGNLGRVVVLRLEDGEDAIAAISATAKKEGIKAAIFYLVGGLKGARVVVGPEKEEMPPVPIWKEIKESHEIIGIGTVFYQDNEPKIHLHSALGKRDEVKVGCVREKAETFLVLEAIILELSGIDAVREFDPSTGLSLLNL
ncbi:MAG: PPC domain-containing DNA-binding protein [Thermodesulfovibrionales bacterium]